MRRTHGGLMGLVARGGKSVATLSLLNPKQFEMKVSDGFRRLGFEVACHAGPPDGGVELVLEKAGVRLLVRCEPWRAQAIGATAIRSLSAIMSDEGAQGGFVVSSGRFTREARDLARACRIELFDENNIDELVST